MCAELCFSYDCRNGRAVGIEYLPNATCHSDEAQETQVARAEKLVVLTAGAFGSPAILERSGIGKPEVLKRAGVEQHIDLPGVGENYQGNQHGISYLIWKAHGMQTIRSSLRRTMPARIH